MSISAVILTKNEQARLPRCLNSLKGLVDEIIIVDDCSTDETVSYAKREYHAKVVVNPLDNNFDKQRNIGIAAATHEWILQMDADEEVSSQSAQAIRRAIASGQYDGYSILRQDCIFGKPLKFVGGCHQLKLFRKALGYYEGAIHEALKLNGIQGRIDEPIWHYAIDSVGAMIARQNFYTDLESAKYLKENPSLQISDVKGMLIGKPIKIFFKHYVKHQGYKDGANGLVWSMIHTLHPIILWLKILEILECKHRETHADRD